MKNPRLGVAAFLLAGAFAAQGQEAATETAAATKEAWQFGASVYGYFPPEDHHYAQPTVTADRGALHLETRYNYEALKSGSAWIGWNVETGKELKLNATLMAGGVVGDLRGVAPGYELTLSWKAFELYSEGEYVFDTTDSSGNFFYNWAQLGFCRSTGSPSASPRSARARTTRASTCSAASSSASRGRA